MPTPPSTIKEFTNLLLRSKLMAAPDVDSVVSQLANDDLDSLRRRLVTQKHLTEYQAAILARGHTEGFFLGEYKILDLISKGRMSGVYKAVHPTGQIVAIKVLPASKAKNAEALGRFRREGRLLTRLDHPNVVKAFQVGESDGRHYFVLEYLEGETLADILERRIKLSPTEALRIVQQALTGLQHIHDRGTIHRDLNPGNLMLLDAGTRSDSTLDRQVKILDIGFGKAVFDEAAKSHVDDPTTLTAEGILLGSPDYLAPEQAKKAANADIRSDIYSLGCVLFHALTGQPPFKEVNVLKLVMRHASEQPRPLADFIVQVPDGLQIALNWMMAKDPAQRYSTPERAAQALMFFLKGIPAPKAGPTPLPTFVKYLDTTAEFEPDRAGIPVGRLESAGSRRPAKGIPVAPSETAPSAPEAPAPRPQPVVAANPTPVSRPQPVVAAAIPIASLEEEINVELVSLPNLEPPPPRGLLDIDRRDAFMVCAGGGMVLAAILLGYGMSKLLRKEPTDVHDSDLPKGE